MNTQRRLTRLVGAAALTLGTLLVLADIAPTIAAPAGPAATLARSVLAPTCHQQPARSFVLRGSTLSSCARCAGLHLAALVGGGLLLFAPARPWRRLRSQGWLALAGIPLGVDVMAGMTWAGWDHPAIRAATGLVAGVGILLVADVRGPSDADPVAGRPESGESAARAEAPA